jgi:hypothetical protein
MNKLMQAVNALKGDLGNSRLFSGDEVFLHQAINGVYVAFTCRQVSEASSSNCICTVEEFNNLVAELSAAEWIK